jgi:hypothetical protein
VEVDLEPDRIPATLVEWVRHQPDALHYQFVLTARRADPGSEPAPRPRVIPAVPLDAVRAQDAYTEQMRQQQDLRHRLLTTRDHIIGLEARASAADDRLRWTEGRLRRTRTRANRLQKQVRDMEASTTWRVGRLITSPFRRGR